MLKKNLTFFKENWPHQPAKMTICAETIPYVAESIIELEEMGINFTANIGFEDIWGDRENKKRLLDIYEQQLDILVEYYANRPGLYPVSPILEALPGYLSLPDHGKSRQKEEKRYCGAGHEMVVVDVDGSTYPCHRFLPWITGKKLPTENANCQTAWQPEECAQCKLILSCPTCAGFNWEINGDTGTRTTYHCDSFKLEVLASAKLEAIKLDNRFNEIDDLNIEEKSKIKNRLESIIDLIETGF
jgi:radical SAM protein with 4Fe4S-binding SPASM domain